MTKVMTKAEEKMCYKMGKILGWHAAILYSKPIGPGLSDDTWAWFNADDHEVARSFAPLNNANDLEMVEQVLSDKGYKVTETRNGHGGTVLVAKGKKKRLEQWPTKKCPTKLHAKASALLSVN